MYSPFRRALVELFEDLAISAMAKSSGWRRKSPENEMRRPVLTMTFGPVHESRMNIPSLEISSEEAAVDHQILKARNNVIENYAFTIISNIV
jgi:hypothetical protein